MISETLTSAVEFKADDGTVVPGVVDFIVNLDEQIIGLRFTPTTRLTDGMAYTITLKGGEAGILAGDGRRMAADYLWRFIAAASLDNNVFLPLVVR